MDPAAKYLQALPVENPRAKPARGETRSLSSFSRYGAQAPGDRARVLVWAPERAAGGAP